MAFKVIYFWKALHFSVFAFLKYIQRQFNRIGYWYNHTKIVRKIWANRGIYTDQEIQKAIEKDTTNPRTSLISIQAGIHMGGIFVLIEFTIAYLVLGVLGKGALAHFHEHVFLYGVLFLIPGGVMNYVLLFKHDRYLRDFEGFEKLPKQALKRLKLLSALFILSVVAAFFISLLWAMEQ